MLGIFDSGLGGLTVVKEVFKVLPWYRVLYFGDTARTPYGNKGRETIIKYALEDAEFLVSKGAKAIIIACNTVSALAADILREKFNIPIFEVVTPAIKKALEITKNGRLGVIGTRAMVSSRIYEKLITTTGGYSKTLHSRDKKIQIFPKACPLLVPLIEEGWLKKGETKRIIKNYLQRLKVKGIDTLILGCTHYPLVKKMIQAKMGKRVTLVDPAKEVAQEVKKFLRCNPEIEKGLTKDKNHHFFVSDLTPHFQNIAQNWLQKKIKLEEMAY